MYTKFNIENGKFFFSHIAIKDSSKTEKSKKKIFTNDSHIVRILGSKEAAFNYYNRGSIKGKGVFS